MRLGERSLNPQPLHTHTHPHTHPTSTTQRNVNLVSRKGAEADWGSGCRTCATFAKWGNIFSPGRGRNRDTNALRPRRRLGMQPSAIQCPDDVGEDWGSARGNPPPFSGFASFLPVPLSASRPSGYRRRD